MHFNVRLHDNRFPILFEPFALKNPDDDTYEYDMVTYEQADESFLSFLKYSANFIFYRFGLEVNENTSAQNGNGSALFVSSRLGMLHYHCHRHRCSS